MKRRTKLQLVLLAFFALLTVTPGVAVSAEVASMTGTAALVGEIHEEVSRQPLGFVHLMLIELGYTISSHPDGSYHFFRVPPGEYTLRATRIGYRDQFQRVVLAAGDTLQVDLILHHKAMSLPDVEVKGERERIETVRHAPVSDLVGGRLQRNLGTTIAETVGREPGIAQRSMGPAPARPVLRGLSGDRLLILEDGQRTGDLSGGSSDHAVAIEPVTASQIEVLRGPETLLYGPGVLGGVVDVKRGEIVRNEPHRIFGSALLEGGTVHQGGAGGASLTLPLSPLLGGAPFAVRMDASLRKTGDIRTPSGQLGNTALQTRNGSGSLSFLPKWGVIGVAGAAYDSEYGIPGGFVGGHPNGVDIEMQRNRLDVNSALYIDWVRLKRLELDYSFSSYQHTEYESSGSVGMRFGVLTDHLDLKLHLGRHAFFESGVFGISGDWRNYATSGLSFTPDARESSLGAFLYQQREFNAFHFDMAVRYDLRTIQPESERSSVFVGRIRERSFSGFSGALRGETHVSRTLTAGVSLMKSYRSPTIEELFSEGPHLAAYSYEVGDADLGSEDGYGTEIYLKKEYGRFRGHTALFLNQFDSYLYPRNTGRFSPRRADLYEYRYVGVGVQMTGAEGSVEVDVADHFTLKGSASFVKGQLTGKDEYLPMIPPLHGGVGLSWHCCVWSLDLDMMGAWPQRSVGEFEEPTAGWARVDVTAHYQKVHGGMLHSIVIGIENLLDSEYRQHLSRIKSVMPEPGRNLKVVYKVYF